MCKFCDKQFINPDLTNHLLDETGGFHKEVAWKQDGRKSAGKMQSG